MRYLVSSLALLLISSPAFAQVAAKVPSPEMDLGLAGLVMIAGAAFLALRRRRD